MDIPDLSITPAFRGGCGDLHVICIMGLLSLHRHMRVLRFEAKPKPLSYGSNSSDPGAVTDLQISVTLF
ncbi:MAG: hypothetical protein ACFB11_19345 [Paracoccaceae bacterium]